MMSITLKVLFFAAILSSTITVVLTQSNTTTTKPCTRRQCSNAQVFDDYLCDCVCLSELHCPGQTVLNQQNCTCQCIQMTMCQRNEVYDSFSCVCTPHSQLPNVQPPPQVINRQPFLPYPFPYQPNIPSTYPSYPPYYPQPPSAGLPYRRPYVNHMLPPTNSLLPRPNAQQRIDTPDAPHLPTTLPNISPRRCPRHRCQGYMILDESTCECYCPRSTQARCGSYKQLDVDTCMCQCPTRQCSPNHIMDYSTCQCVCPLSLRHWCTNTMQKFDESTCTCTCSQVLLPSRAFQRPDTITSRRRHGGRGRHHSHSHSNKRRQAIQNSQELEQVGDGIEKRRAHSKGRHFEHSMRQIPIEQRIRLAPCPIGLYLNTATCECHQQ